MPTAKGIETPNAPTDLLAPLIATLNGIVIDRLRAYFSVPSICIVSGMNTPKAAGIGVGLVIVALIGMLTLKAALDTPLPCIAQLIGIETPNAPTDFACAVIPAWSIIKMLKA
jgi:hypothetical protein